MLETDFNSIPFEINGKPAKITPSPEGYWLEWTNDSGASRAFGSLKSIAKSGIPLSVLKKVLSQPTVALTFNTANGKFSGDQSFGLSGPCIWYGPGRLSVD